MPAEDFAARMARVNDPVYRLYAWVYFAHPFLVVTAALGVAMALRREAASLVVPGLLSYGLAMWRRRGLSRVVGGLYFAAAALTLQIILAEVDGAPLLPEALDFWVYPLIQPLARTLIGAWPWKKSAESDSASR